MNDSTESRTVYVVVVLFSYIERRERKKNSFKIKQILTDWTNLWFVPDSIKQNRDDWETTKKNKREQRFFPIQLVSQFSP